MIRIKHAPVVAAISLTVLIIVVGTVSILFIINFSRFDRYERKDFIDPDAYQAIFLTNDQIYFGHLKNISPDYLMLENVYYVKVNDSGAGQIVKLGVIEPHGPQDKMIINQDQVLYWENLKLNSPVTETIKGLQLKEK